MLIVAHESTVVKCKASENALVGILCIFRFLLEGLLVVVVKETILRTIGTLSCHETGTIAKRQLLAINTNPHQITCRLAEGILAIAVLYHQQVVVLRISVLLGILA